jgi:transglycosylase-like protein with SLT domain
MRSPTDTGTTVGRRGSTPPGTSVGVGARHLALAAAAVVAIAGCTPAPSGASSAASDASASRPAAGGAGTGGAGTGQPAASGPARDPTADPGDPARFAAPVRRYAGAAGIDAQLLMAILYNESDKPHEPGLERAWQRIHPDAAFGVANMHRAAFDDTKRGRDFADRRWEELPDDPALAIEAAAWYLHDLAAALPASWPARYTRDELLALGYNAGPGSMVGFAHGDKPGPVAQTYLDRLHATWDAAARALR